MLKYQKATCRHCNESLLTATAVPPADAQRYRCEGCGELNYIPGGTDCDCPVPGTGQGCSCRVARFPQLKFASDEWCWCRCHL